VPSNAEPARVEPGTADVVRVRLRLTRRTALQIAGRLLLAGVSVLFVVGGASDPASFGGALFLLLGAAGAAMFAGGALAMTGHLLTGRPVLEIGAAGVRRPAAWPRRAGRLLRWPDLAGVCAWSQGVPHGRHHEHHLTFLPRGRADRPAAGAETLAVKVTGVPGVPDPRWSIPVTAAWDRSVDDVVAAVHGHRPDVPFADRRDPVVPRRPGLRWGRRR
jgi:hypothetical protein